MKLSHYTLKNISADHILMPAEEILTFPEKVLQFGTGMLLRGLPDYYIDKANRKGIFKGRIVVVKSTTRGDTSAFDKQDGLYTISERGVWKGEVVERDTVCSAISRVLNANDEWEEILKSAHNPDMEIIISNTTEMGIKLVKDDIRRYPPVSFPGKLLAFLYERFIAFDGDLNMGFVIIPTELLPDNGKMLESIVMELAHLNGLDDEFIEWLEGANTFCNSLVDRIVTGMPDQQDRDIFFDTLGYRDDLLTVTEVYSLWAIEGDERIKNILSFWKAHEGIVIEPEINMYRELKLRLLNATHTLASGIAFLSNIDTVKDAMDHPEMSGFISRLMKQEISHAIPMEMPHETKMNFSENVLDRFRNPHIRHRWKTIAQNYSEKMKLRFLPLLIHHYELNEEVPSLFAFGMAAWICYMKAVKKEDGKYYGQAPQDYLIEDPRAETFFNIWHVSDSATAVKKILGDSAFWEEDLMGLPGFYERVLENVNLINNLGMEQALVNINQGKMQRV